MGIIHGMAGSAALILLFVDQVDSISTGLAYITIFGLGSILGMFVFSLVISVPLGMTAKKLKFCLLNKSPSAPTKFVKH